MSSSAFFIEAAANTVRLLSCASAGERADPHRMARLRKSPARRCIMALHRCLRRVARANQASVEVVCDRRKRRSGNPADLRSVRTSQRKGYLIVEARKRLCAVSQAREMPAHSEAGTIATLIESASTPEIWMVKGFGGISNFTLFRIPSQPLTPLDVTNRRNCPSCTTSIQPAAERLTV